MYFGVLGQLFLGTEEHVTLLRGQKQVVLLGVLLSQANSAVSAGRLIEALWGASPPASAGTTLRWHVHQLRRALADEARIARLRSGYGLTVHPGELDAERFEQLVIEGRDRLDEPDAERASVLLQQALTLWRGPAYAELADLDLPAVHDEAARLGELRLVAQHHQIEADQMLGRDRALVPKLRALVAEHPLREGFRAQLMLALYRSGQQADALEVYRHGRRVLAEELGIDPGPELKRLERAILSGAPDLRSHSNGADAARVFRLAGLLEVPDLGVSTVAALADLPPRHADGLLDLLVAVQLMENDVPGRYRLHDLLRLFARERAAGEEPEPERAAALLRALHHCVDTARAASVTIRPTAALWIRTGASVTGHQARTFSSIRETNEWVEAELETFLPLAAQAARLPGDGPELAVGLAAALVGPLGACGLGIRQRALSDVASGAAQRTGVPGHLAIASYMRGLVLHSIDPKEAARQLCAARKLWSESGNQYAEALALQHLGTTAGSLGQYARSLECLTEALQAFRRLASLDGEATTLDHLGLAYRRLRREDESIAAYRSGLALARKVGDRVLEAIGATNLATVLHFFGDVEAAIPAYEEALELSRSYGNRLAEAECLWGLAEASGERGQTVRRSELLLDSTDLLCALGVIGRDQQQEILAATRPAVPPGFWTNI
jgi:DNA-binding SARP family transcriptional activator